MDYNRSMNDQADTNAGKQMNAATTNNSEPNPADAPAVGELAADDPNDVQKETTYNLLVDGIDYLVAVTPFLFNDETRYYVKVNDGPTNLFLWDSQMNQIRSLDDTASILPDGLEKAISDQLLTEEKKSI